MPWEASERRNFVFSVTLTEVLIIFLFVLLLASLPKIADLAVSREEQGSLQLELAETKRELEAAKLSLEEERDRIAGLELWKELDRRGDDFKRLVQRAGAVERAESELENRTRLIEEQREEAERVRASLEQRLATCESELGEDQLSCFERVKVLELQMASLRRQFGGKGNDHPPCWPSEEPGENRGKAEYLLDARVLEDGLEFERGWPAHREQDASEIPELPALLRGRLSTEEFREVAQPLLERSDQDECRHYIRVYDRARSKQSFKAGLLTLEEVFYKYLIRDGSGE